MKILVVDDSRAMRRIVAQTLEQAGFAGHQILEAENGKLALEAARTHRPDLILSDWHMPEMTGIELLAALNGEGLDIPFGFLTSESTPQMVQAAAEAGAVFLVAKPFTPGDIAQALGILTS